MKTFLSCVVAAGVACSVSAAEVVARTLTVEVDEQAKGAVTRLVTAQGADLASEIGTTPLFALKLTRVDDFTKSVTVNSSLAKTCVCEKTAGSVRLVYKDLGEACAEVVCSIRGVGDYVRWGITVTTRTGWALEETSYPRLLLSHCLGGSPNDDAYVVGSAKGGIVRNPGAKGLSWRNYAKEPGNLVAQFATLYDERAGLYYGIEDAKGFVKYIGAENVKSGLVLLTQRRDFETGVVCQAYDVVTGGFEGTPADPCTWHDAADLYKKWAVKQTWCGPKLKNRTDLPAWMKDAPAMVRFNRDWIQNPEIIRRWMVNYWRKEFPAAPLVMAYWGWEKRGTWVTPDYFPVVPDNETFASLVKDMKSLGGHAFPWPSGYHWTLMYDQKADGTFVWDDRERFERVAKPHSIFTRAGTRYNRVPSWLRGGHTACMCGGDPWTIDWWNKDICLPLAKLGCEMIQVDQVVGGAFPECWAKNHPHAPGEGCWKTDCFRKQLVTMRETMRTCEPDSIVCFEEPNEHFNHIVGIQDYRDCESRADEWASVFNYLYHEYVPCFQSNPRRGNRMWQAHEAADGQIPFLTPTSRDCEGAAPALLCGDFEKVSGDGRRFVGWEKLNGYNGVVWDGSMAIDRQTKHDGAASIRLSVKPGENAVQVSQNISLDDAAFHGPGKKFRLSAWLKTGHSERPNSVNFCFLGGRGKGGSLVFPKPEEGWKKVSCDFTIAPGPESLRIMMHLAGDAEAWVDSMKLEEVLADGTTKEIVISGRGAYDAFMRRWVELYHGAAREWLAFGRQIKPPRIVCGDQPYSMSFHGGAKLEGRQPNVFCNAYEAADGRKAVVVVNATGEKQAVTLYQYGTRKQLVLEPDEIRLLAE